MSKGSISKKKNPTPEKGIRKNEKEGVPSAAVAVHASPWAFGVHSVVFHSRKRRVFT